MLGNHTTIRNLRYCNQIQELKRKIVKSKHCKPVAFSHIFLMIYVTVLIKGLKNHVKNRTKVLSTVGNVPITY